MADNYEQIATTTLTSAQTTITFSSIPGTYKDLRLTFFTVGNAAYPQLKINNNTTASLYSDTTLVGDGSTASTANYTSDYPFNLYALGATASNPTFYTLDFFSYANTNIFKTYLYTGQEDKNGTGQVRRAVALFRSTSAITQLDIFGNANSLFAGTSATLYGIKAGA